MSDKILKSTELKNSTETLENLEKKCPRCGKTSANKNNPSGRCRTCLNKLAANKKKPGHWQRAQTKADDALRRQNGDNGTAHHKSNGRGSRASIVKQVQRAEKKTGQKLSPDRKDNNKGYASSNTRMVPEKLNRGRHTVDKKKLRAWQKRLNKTDTSHEEFYTYLLAKASKESDTATYDLLQDMHPNDLANFINNNDIVLEKSIGDEVDDVMKTEPNVSKWTRLPNTAEGGYSWSHPDHGTMTLTPKEGKYHVRHGETSLGAFPQRAQAIEMTSRYMRDMGMKPPKS